MPFTCRTGCTGLSSFICQWCIQPTGAVFTSLLDTTLLLFMGAFMQIHPLTLLLSSWITWMTPILSHCVLNFGLNPSHFVRSFHAFIFLHLSTYQCSGGKKCLLYKEVGKIKLLSQYLILSHFLLKTKFNQEMHTIACVYCLQQQLCEWPRCWNCVMVCVFTADLSTSLHSILGSVLLPFWSRPLEE